MKVPSDWNLATPEVVRAPSTVEEADARNPWFREARPIERKVLPEVKAPETVEEAVAVNPPDASRVKSVVEALSWTRSAGPL